MFDMPVEFFINKELIQALYNIYVRKNSNTADTQKAITNDLLKKKILLLIATQELNERLNNLIVKLNRIALKVFEVYSSLKKKKADKATVEKRMKETTTAGLLSTTARPSTTAGLSTIEAARRGRISKTVRASTTKATTRRRTIANAQNQGSIRTQQQRAE